MTHHQYPDDDAHAEFADWDAAYVLGALSTSERTEFEQHLSGCRRCTAGVTELAGVPGLLGRIDPADVDALLVAGSIDTDEPGPPADLMARITRADDRRRSRRIRRRVGILVAAAVIAAAGVVVPIALTGDPQPTVAATLTGTSDNPLTADVQLFSEQWGTSVVVTCGYAVDGTRQYQQPSVARAYGLYVVNTAGAATLVSSWTAQRGETVHATGATKVEVPAIRTLQIRSIDSGTVLLAADLG